jgi:hypothetical protein
MNYVFKEFAYSAGATILVFALLLFLMSFGSLARAVPIASVKIQDETQSNPLSFLYVTQRAECPWVPLPMSERFVCKIPPRPVCEPGSEMSGYSIAKL